MSLPFKRLTRRLLFSVAAAAGVGLVAPSGRAELLVNGLPDPAVQDTANFQPCSAAATDREQEADLLDGLFHPVGLFMVAGYLPMPWMFPAPPSSGSAPPPNDPNITIQVPLPNVVAPQPVFSTVNGPPPSLPPGSSPPGGGTVGSVHQSPEPATFVSGMLGMGLLSFFGWRRRRQL